MISYACKAQLRRHEAGRKPQTLAYHQNRFEAMALADLLRERLSGAEALGTWFSVDIIGDDGSIRTEELFRATPDDISDYECITADGATVRVWDSDAGTDARVLAFIRRGLDTESDPITYTFKDAHHMWATLIALERGLTTAGRILEGA